ncbi:T9SS type B sorting domain-containing protein [Williamwhitmania taraxaci]|uniref:Gliding motility-associated C-terminal domain-containing protein n=1 Tax=Williamwhitmania taraxaci TaxID=1640674 RepID=A0A1G6H2X7_9BACT|nr:gliding motility-associated C-terminal domain-containing protein [Williamwhitmania taraxaci]SDB88657.1 gliding motility-associated C-terminal domain-containing protein [Williamwhitmania taraxaci]
MNRIIAIAAFILINLHCFATHNRAGEITYRQISGSTYEIIVVTYTSSLPGTADRPSLMVSFGDNVSLEVARYELIFLSNNYKRNTYKVQHTFPGAGTYDIMVEDPNRNYGVKNIPNSVFTVFTIKSTLVINAALGNNTTPQLLNPPIDLAGKFKLFVHNPAAYDAEGDSISYALTSCLGEDGNPIPGYVYPPATESISVNPTTGDLIWKTPSDTGSFNVAINVMEWRNGIKIGNIVRDMQIDVRNTTNNPPINDPLLRVCTEAGKKITLLVTSRDQDNDPVSHKVIGGPLSLAISPANELKLVSVSSGIVTSEFSWKTDCSHIRAQPYEVILKAEDNNSRLNLVDMDPILISIKGPAPKNLVAEPATNAVTLRWESCGCGNASSYNIYRKVDPSTYIIDSCTTGVLPLFGFTKVGTVGPSNLEFIDNNNGSGLVLGGNYCYRIAAVFDLGLEGYVSDEVCTTLVPGLPFISNVSVEEDDLSSGRVDIAWRVPSDFDAVQFPGPYKYNIFRSADLWGSNFQPIGSITGSLSDTTYSDTPVNTIDGPYSYMVELFDLSKNMKVGYPGIASTTLPELQATDEQINIHMANNTPWQNNTYQIFRSDAGDPFSLINTIDSRDYSDQYLTNGKDYTYFAISQGTYTYKNAQFATVNRSHIRSLKPLDNIPPCAPSLSIAVSCDSLYNMLNWTLPTGPCSHDVASYILYYSNLVDKDMDSLTYIPKADQLNYLHYPSKNLGGAYGIVAVDSAGNRSAMTRAVASDSCSLYDLPNVFTPNGDGINDLFVPINQTYQYVERISIKIFNRYGELVFETTDPEIRWNGKVKGSDKLASPGVYYYICDIWELRSVGVFQGPPKVGFVYLLSDKSKNSSD